MKEPFEIHSISCSRRLNPLKSLSEKEAKEVAKEEFIKQLGYVSIDVPLISDARGYQQCVRYSLRDFLK